VLPEQETLTAGAGTGGLTAALCLREVGIGGLEQRFRRAAHEPYRA
jgi:hypothetical protein